MYCQECGKQNVEHATFCKYCGSQLNDLDKAIETSTLTKAEPTYEEVMLEKVHELANKEMLKGVLWFLGASVLTLMTLGTFFFWGAMLYGVYRLAMGIYYKIFPRKLMHKIDFMYDEE